MPKPRFTIPIAHADDVPTIALTDEKWQAIERAYGRKLNPDVRQQITTVTKHYLKDCVFDRSAAPKKMALKRIRRVRRAAGDLEKVMLDSKPFSASSDELSREQQQSAHSYADGLIRRHLDERRSRARDKLHHFRHALKSLVVACDGALNDLSAARGYRDGEAWGWWIQELTRIAGEYGLPTGVSTELDRNDRPSPFVRLVQELDRYLPADPRQRRSPAALAMAISRARNT
jgi:hypothetical protein